MLKRIEHLIHSQYISAVVLAVLITACSGGANQDTSTALTGSLVASVGTGSVPHYESASELLTLPELKIGESILTDVKVRLKSGGTWAVESKGATRTAAASDRPAAALVSPGNSKDLNSSLSDATLTILRLHVGSRVLGSVAIKLNGNNWSLSGAPEEIKTLHQEDFKSNTAIRADESHHVVLKSSPTTGVQSVPMQLSTRSYKFCMDAQKDGADSTTLIDAAGNTVFKLKAGEPCVTINAREGAYTLEHRYGGSGNARTVFMRNKTNNTNTSLTAVRTPYAAAQRQLKSSLSSGSLQETTTIFPGTEYWSVRQAAFDPYEPTLYRYLGVVLPPVESDAVRAYYRITGRMCTGESGPSFTYADQWLSTTFFAISKSSFGVPVQFQPPVDCKPYSFMDMMFPPAVFATSSGDDVLRLGYVYNSDPTEGIAQSLGITSQSGNQFALIATSDSVTSKVAALVNGYLTASVAPGDVATPMAVAFRYFPDGLPANVALGVGQVALFTGANCSGVAAISENISMPSFNANTLPGLSGLGSSFKLGLQTSAIAYANQLYLGESSRFDQLTCNSGGFGSTGWAPASMRVLVDTITMVLSTDSCEYCNLSGVDFTGHDLTNVKLSHANLSGATLSNVDLSGADLRYVTLQGAYLDHSNLDGANLCRAQFNGSTAVGQAAVMTGAHLRNTNLALAVLDGVKLSSASFYSTFAGSCQQTACEAYVASTCASAYSASINNTSFDSAYLSNVDMGSAKGVGVNFSNAALFGVSFADADLSHNNLSSVASYFNNAYLQGTDFSRAVLKYADFTGAQLDLGSECMQANLSPSYAQFPGSKVPIAPGSGTCVAGKPAAPFCTQSIFAASKTYPSTDCTNICADGKLAGGLGPQQGTCSSTASCSVASWSAPGGNIAIPNTSRCDATAPLCGSNFSSIKNQCW